MPVCRSLRELDVVDPMPPAHAGGFMLSLATRALCSLSSFMLAAAR